MVHQNPHFHKHIKKKKKLTTLDRTVLVAAFINPLTGIPQAIAVFQGDIAGVSLFSWTAFSFFAVLFLLYGIVHKIMPMIVTNFLWLIVDLVIVLGIVTHQMA